MKDGKRGKGIFYLSCALAVLVLAGPSHAAPGSDAAPGKTALSYDRKAQAARDYTAMREAARAGNLERLYELMQPSEESKEMTAADTAAGDAGEQDRKAVGKLVKPLLAGISELMLDDPYLAALILAAITDNWDSMSPEEQESALAQLEDIIAKIQDPDFQREHPEVAAEIMAEVPKLQEKLPPELADRLVAAIETAAANTTNNTPQTPAETTPMNVASPD